MPPSAADLALARELYQRGRLPQATLAAALAEVAPGRPLAAVLVARRLLTQGELASLADPRGMGATRDDLATRASSDGDSRTHADDMTRSSSPGDARTQAPDITRLESPGDARTHAPDMTRLSNDGDPRTHAPDADRTFAPDLANAPGANAPADERTWVPFEGQAPPAASAPPAPADDRTFMPPEGPAPPNAPAPSNAPATAPSAAPTAADWRIGGRVDRFRLDDELGRGGMGVVYLGTDEESGRRVAIKTLLPNASPTAAKRFLREGQAQAAVDEHPNVLRVHGAGESGGRHYLVMDFAAGGDLAGRLKLEGPLPPLEAARLARDLCRGLAHVHARGVVHRDLKPANVLFDEGGAPRLVDFGLAAVEGAERLTATGAFMGTPAYMAPEQAGGEHVGEAADIYGMGAMLYHMLVGRTPFPGSGADVVAKLLTKPPTPPRKLVPDVPEALERVVLKCLAKKPHQRYASAAALADDLERALAGDAVEAPGAARKAPLVAVLVVVAVALAAGAWAVVNHAPEAPTAPVADVAVVRSAAAPIDRLASPTFGLPTTRRAYRCQWYTVNGTPGLLSFRATLTLDPAVVGADRSVVCAATLSDLTVWGGGAIGTEFNADHAYGDAVSLPLTIKITPAGDLSVTGLSSGVRARLWDLLPFEAREHPVNPLYVWPGYVVRFCLDDLLLADVLQLSLPALARDKRGVQPAGSPLWFSRATGPPILFTRERSGTSDGASVQASWVLDDDHGLVSCSFTDQCPTGDRTGTCETWWGIGPPGEFSRLERHR